jgi:hypothetical protein
MLLMKRAYTDARRKFRTIITHLFSAMSCMKRVMTGSSRCTSRKAHDKTTSLLFSCSSLRSLADHFANSALSSDFFQSRLVYDTHTWCTAKCLSRSDSGNCEQVINPLMSRSIKGQPSLLNRGSSTIHTYSYPIAHAETRRAVISGIPVVPVFLGSLGRPISTTTVLVVRSCCIAEWMFCSCSSVEKIREGSVSSVTEEGRACSSFSRSFL